MREPSDHSPRAPTLRGSYPSCRLLGPLHLLKRTPGAGSWEPVFVTNTVVAETLTLSRSLSPRK